MLVAQHQQGRQGDASGRDPHQGDATAHPDGPEENVQTTLALSNKDSPLLSSSFVLLLRPLDAIVQGSSDGPVAIHADHAQVEY